MTIKKKEENLRTIPATSRTTSSYSETSGIEAEKLVPELSPHLDDPDDVMSKDASPVVVVRETRKRWTAEQKLSIIRLTYLEGNTVSSVARQYGIPPPPRCFLAGDQRLRRGY